MSYQVLARKWRPRTFQELVSQVPVVKALTHALDRDQLHPAILLSGTRGVGKTTLGRIIAKSLNCEKGTSGTPCGVCGTCREVEQGRHVDLFEIDAASNTGIDDVRQVIENAQYSPAQGRYKVYLIDEVHMLSKPAFNALLKTLEEPPPHVKFLLATTDPQKLPITVLSRCLQLHLRRIPAADIAARLAFILVEEKIPAEPAALQAIARAAQGSLRDALSLLDQAIAFNGGKQVSAADVQQMLGGLARADVLALLSAVAQRDVDSTLAQLARLDEGAPDYKALLGELSAVLLEVARQQLAPALQQDADHDPEWSAALTGLAQQLTAEDVQLFYQIVINGRRDLQWALDERAGVEMTLLRMLAFHFADAEADVRPSSNPVPNRGAPTAPVAAPVIPARPVSPPATSVASSVSVASVPVSTAARVDDWSKMLERLPLSEMDRSLLRECGAEGWQGDTLVLRLPPSFAGLLNERRLERIRSVMSTDLGREVKLKIVQGELQGIQTPAAQAEQARSERQRQAEQAMLNDPVVKELQARFGATVATQTIEPID